MNAFDRKGVVKEKRTKIHMSQAIANKMDPYLPLVINVRSDPRSRDVTWVLVG